MIKVHKAKEYIKDGDSEVAKKDSNNCTVYAFASAFGVDYETATQEMTKRFGRVPKKGVPVSKLIKEFEALKESREEIQGCVITEVISQPKKQTKWKLGGDYKLRRTRLKTFLKEYPEGTFYAIMRTHAFTIKDGEVIYNVSRPYPEKIIIKYAFRIERVDAYTIEPTLHAAPSVVPTELTEQHTGVN